MHIVPPFVANSEDDLHCVPAVYRMLWKHFLGKDLTWKEIDAIGHVLPGKGAWTVPFDIALAKEGVFVTNIELTDYERLYKEKEQYLRSAFGRKNADYYISRSNVMNIIDDIPEFLRLVRHESRRATPEEIVKLVKEGKLVAAEVDAGVLNGRGKFNLHFVLIYDTDGISLTLHDPGLPPHSARKVGISEFTKCFAYPGAGCEIDIFSKTK